MTNKDIYKNFGGIDAKLIEKAAPIETVKKTNKTNWVKWSVAVAACICLIITTIFNWTPIIDSKVKNVVLSADEVSGFFDMATNGTNQYTEIYSPSSQYLELVQIPQAEYLPIYSINKPSPTKKDLKNFINEYLDSSTNFFGISTKEFKLEKIKFEDHHVKWNGATVGYRAEIVENRKYLRFNTRENLLSFSYLSLDEKRFKINGNLVSILESDNDEQIKEKLKATITYVCSSFGKNYSDVKITRKYLQRQLGGITVYLYNPQKTTFPSNFLNIPIASGYNAPMVSEYISLTFCTDLGSGSVYSWGGSKDEAFLVDISLCKAAKNWSEYYEIEAKSKILNLEEAEKLLKKGYVFGGHSCPLCMAEQPEVDFSDYTYVGIEYVANYERTKFFPFYAFYKYIGESSDGIGTYAKTYVPAVEVSGLEEYFNLQSGKHQSNNFQ